MTDLTHITSLPQGRTYVLVYGAEAVDVYALDALSTPTLEIPPMWDIRKTHTEEQLVALTERIKQMALAAEAKRYPKAIPRTPVRQSHQA